MEQEQRNDRDRNNMTNNNCPAGFVWPSSPLDPRVISVPNGNGCALACTLPGYFSNEDTTRLLQIMIGVSATGLPMICAVILTWSTNRIRMEKQYLILIFACLSAFFSLWILITSSKALIANNTFCSTNATERDQRDGINVCVVEGAVIVYCLLAISFTWTLQAVELFRKLVMLKLRSSKMRTLLHLGIIFGLPSFAIIYGSYQGGFGYGRILPFCMIAHSAPPNLDFAFLYLPMFIRCQRITVHLLDHLSFTHNTYNPHPNVYYRCFYSVSIYTQH